MKTTTISSILITLGIITSIIIACNQRKNEDTLQLDQKETLPTPIGESQGLPIYESADFIKNLKNPQNLEYPILIQPENDDYIIDETTANKNNPTSNNARNVATMGIRILNPLLSTAATASSASWSPPSHHRPWNGDWAGDLWKSNGTGVDYDNTCNRNIYFYVQSYSINGKYFDQIKGKVAEEGYACRSQVESHGGHMQKIALYGKYNNIWHPLGWAVYAHIDDGSFNYNVNDEFIIANYPYAGVVYLGKLYDGFQTNCGSSCCSQSCHLHFELDASGWSNYHLSPNNPNIHSNSAIASVYKWVSNPF